MNIRSFSASRCIFFILFLFALDLFDLSGALISFGIVFFLLFYIKEIKLDLNSVTLILFSFSYFLSVFFFEGATVDRAIKYAICPWACYVLGFNLMRIRKDLTVTKFSDVLFAGFFLHGFLNLVASVIQYGVDFNNPFRLAFDFWQNRTISVTTASLYYTPMVLLAIGLLFSNNRRKKKIIPLLVIAVGIFATILYQNRTLIASACIVVVAAILFLLRDKNVSKRTKHTIVGAFLLFLILACIIWFTDIAGLRSLIENTSFYGRLSGSNGEGQDRTKIWASFILGDAWKYPFGGNKVVLYDNKTYVHNAWFDIYRRTGIIPFCSICIFTISSVKTVVQFKKYSKSSTDIEDYQSLALALLGVASAFFVEPVIEANPYIFYLPILVVGAMNGRMFDRRGK